MIPEKSWMEARLINNPQWQDLYEPKPKLINYFQSEFEKIEAESGNEYAMKVYRLVTLQFQSARWGGKAGPYGLFKAMLRKAKLQIKQEEEKEPKKIENLVSEIVQQNSNMRFT